MSSIIEGVDQRTRLVGRNRLELLLFRLGTEQRFGINVFKVREVIRCPSLTRMPHAQQHVRGVARLRGMTISVIDLSHAVGGESLADERTGFVIVSEFNRHVQGFLVASVDRIVNLNWESMRHPPSGAGVDRYLTAVTDVEGDLVEVLDVEKVFAEVIGVNTSVHTDQLVDESGVDLDDLHGRILVVDDSSVARRQIARTLEQIGLEYELAGDGAEALELLVALERDGKPAREYFDAVISDIEMPSMDGYTLTKKIRGDDRFNTLPVVLHTSLSGVFNQAMVERVGANEFVPKFDADDLARVVLRMMGRDENSVAVAA